MTPNEISETIGQYLERLDALEAPLEAPLDRIEALALELAELCGIDITTLPSWAVLA